MAKSQRTAAVTAHYTPKLSDAVKVGTTDAVEPVLRGAVIAGWLAGVTDAGARSDAIASAVAANGLDLGAPADAGVDWGETADIPSKDLPSALAIRLSDLDTYAQNILDSDVDREPDDQAAITIRSTANGIAEQGAQTAYQAGGVEKWNVELDGDNPCPECEAAEAGGPYDVGDGPDLPIHAFCECESAPVTDSSESRSAGHLPRSTPMSEDTDKPGRRPRARRELALQHEMRRFQPNEIRAGKPTDDGLVPLEGVVIRYGVPYEVTDMAGTFTETIHRGSAAKVLAGKPDIRMLFNHDGMPLARTGAEASLEAWETDEGLCIRALVDPRQTIANDLIVALERGTVTQMSVGMQVDRDNDQWSGEDEYGLPNVRNIFGLTDIFDASAVTYPASTTTTLALASRMSDLPPEITVRTQKLWDLAREGRKGTISQADSDTLMHLIEDLHTLRQAEEGRMAPDGVRDPLEPVSTVELEINGAAIADAVMSAIGKAARRSQSGADLDLTDEEQADLVTRTLDLLAEHRAAPTSQDPIIAKKIADAHVAVGAALAAQAKDPDNNSDPTDKKVWNHLSNAHSALTSAMQAQGSDGAPDDNGTTEDGGPDGTLNGSGPSSGIGGQDGTGARSILIDIDLDMARLRRSPVRI